MNEKNVTPPVDEFMAVHRAIHAILAGGVLPRTKVDGERYVRWDGCTRVLIDIQAGYLDDGRGPVLQPIPYGPMARLILAWASTFALRHKRQSVPIRETPDRYLYLMGLDSGKYDLAALREQLHALAACRIQYSYKGRAYSIQPFAQVDAWLPPRTRRAPSPCPHELVLSDEYYQSLLASALPLDYHALEVLRDSPVALDMYMWLAYLLPRIRDKVVVVSSEELRERFGREGQGKLLTWADFKKVFLTALERVRAVYPRARVRNGIEGLILFSSPPPVPYKKGTAVSADQQGMDSLVVEQLAKVEQ